MADQPKPRGRPPCDYGALPLPRMIDWRWVWRRAEVENVRRVLAGETKKPVKAAKANDELVTITQLAKELRMSRRNVVRWVDNARAERAEARAPEAKPDP